MKKLTSYIIGAVLSLFITFTINSPVTAQERGNKEARPSPNASVSQTIGTTEVTITYGRPGVKGRKIFGDLVPFNTVWRTGANESTAITFSDDVKIEGKSLKAGTYSLYTIPTKDKWTIIFNSKLSWGTQYDKSKDVLRIKASSKKAQKMEQLLISFTNVTDTSAHCTLHWNKTSASFTIET